MPVIFLRAPKVAVGGGDITPGAINWGNITNVGEVAYGLGYNSAQVMTGLTSAVQLRAAWTSTSSTPARGAWIKNGTIVSAFATTPAYVNVSNGDSVYFYMVVYTSDETGNYDTGTVTVTNITDGGAAVDTFTFTLQYVPGAEPPPEELPP